MSEEKMTNIEDKPAAVRKSTKTSELQAKKSSANVKSGKQVAKTKRAGSVRPSEMHAVRSFQVVNVKKKRSDKKPLPWGVIFTAIILTAMFLFMMMNYAEVDKYRSEIADLDSKIASLQKTQDNLSVTLSNKYNLAEIKDYAENELGMVTKDKLSSHRITVEQDDRVEMRSYDDGEEGGIGFLLNGLGEVIRDFWPGK